MNAAIRRLPDATSSLLRSSVILPSLTAILIELVQNAIDAHAKTIVVSFDLTRWTIKCEDDGRGMQQLDTVTIGERYWSSKGVRGGESDQGFESFGFRGEALASMADMALLEILTRPCRRGGDVTDNDEGDSYTLLIRGGVKLAQGKATTKRTAVGTTVWVRDIFYKWPVRRKPLTTPSARLALINLFRITLATIALVHPLISFSLHDLASSSSATSASKLLISVSRASKGMIGRWRQLWGRAGVEKIQEIEAWEDEGRTFGLVGFLSCTASHSKSSQFIFVNARPLASSSPLQKLINDLFSRSSFSRHASSHLIAPVTTSPVKSASKSPKKATERYPIFVLNLLAPPGLIDVTLEPEKRVIEFEDEERVHAFLRRIINAFLVDQGFLHSPPLPTTDYCDDTASPLRRPLDSQNLKEPPSILVKQKEAFPSAELIVFPGRGGGQSEDSTDDEPIEWTDPQTKQRFFVDPRTGNSWKPSNTRGLCASRTQQNVSDDDDQRMRGRVGLVDTSRLRKRSREEGEGEVDSETGVPEWMVTSINQWQNPIFPSATTLQIPSVPSITQHSLSHLNDTSASSSKRQHQESSGPHPMGFTSSFHNSGDRHCAVSGISGGSGQKFTKESLRDCEFIAQVDKKFLLVKLRSASSSLTPPHPAPSNASLKSQITTLVMVDQHAASERVRVESFLSTICGAVARGEAVKVHQLEGSVGVILSREEARELSEWENEFERWGIKVDSAMKAEVEVTTRVDQDGVEDYRQIRIVTVPHIVSDRLRADNRLLQELIRSFLAVLRTSSRRRGPSVSSSSVDNAAVGKDATVLEEGGDWLSVLSEMPPVLLDLINSKSCRGAIMFNDELSTSQSVNLLSSLATTRFPFQCAHGRPSIVPLLNLASPVPVTADSGQIGEEERRVVDWSRFA